MSLRLTVVVFVALVLTSTGCASDDSAREGRPEPTGEIGDRAETTTSRHTSPPVFPPPWQVPSETVANYPFLPGEDVFASVAIGDTSNGRLVNGQAMPMADHYAALPVHWSRGVAFGTEQLIETIVTGADAVAEMFPGSVLYLGNIGQRAGGDIPWSVSHNNGRDADLAYFSTNPLGWQVRPSSLLHFDETLASTEHHGFYRFDVPRNAVLIEAIQTAPHGEVQYMFMARHLQRPVIAWLSDHGVDVAVIGQLREVLHEPRTALPHDDHLHLRVYCSQRDACGGCINNGKMRPWVDGFEDDRVGCSNRFAEMVATDDSPATRAAAVLRLGLLAASRQTPVVVAALGDEDRNVRRAAAEVLGGFANNAAVQALVTHDRGEEDIDVRCAIAVSLGQIEAQTATDHLATMLTVDGNCTLEPNPTVPLAAVVAGSVENKESRTPVEALIAALSDPRPEVRVPVATALRKLTNRAEDIDWADPALDEATLQAAREGWQKWHKRRRKKTRDEWLVLGFRAAGYRVRALDAQNVPRLLDAVLGPPHISYNAQRVLMRIADDTPASLDWSTADAAWYWTRQFKRRQDEFGLDLSDRPERPVPPTP